MAGASGITGNTFSVTWRFAIAVAFIAVSLSKRIVRSIVGEVAAIIVGEIGWLGV
jgi:Zn-dependent protease with chaperone function